jgi:hypothetical protein
MQRTEEKEHCRHSDGYPISGAASDSFKIRRATVRDADVIAWHRARMFQDMGNVSGDAFEILRTKAQARLKRWIDSGDYIGWLATSADKPETIAGGLVFSYNRSCHAQSTLRQLDKAGRER